MSNQPLSVPSEKSGYRIRRRDPAYDHLRSAVKPAVHNYKHHTRIVETFINGHSVPTELPNAWDVAPYHVLNKRRGSKVPAEILFALDAAILGRDKVGDKFTEQNINPRTLFDASDISHRVFVDKLRTIRRLWFPDAPEIPTNVSVVPMPAQQQRDSLGPFTVLAATAHDSKFYKIAFECPVRLTVTTGETVKAFNLTAGHVKVTQVDSAPTEPFTQHDDHRLVPIRSTVRDADVIAAAPARATLESAGRLVRRKRPHDFVGNTRITRSMKRAKVMKKDPSYIEISSDEEEGRSGATDIHQGMPVPESGSTASHKPEGEDAQIGDTPTFPKPHTVEIFPDGDCVTISGPDRPPCTYLDESNAKGRLQVIIWKKEPVIVTASFAGRTRQLSALAVDHYLRDSRPMGKSVISLRGVLGPQAYEDTQP